MIKLWAFDFSEIQGREPPDSGDPRVLQDAFDTNLARLASLESAGFEGVFFSEHHFLSLLCPSPNLLIAALAQRSRTLRLGVMGNVLPFHQPWRLVEELGMLDYLTHGRLEVGVSVGIPAEPGIIGIPPGEVRPRYEEALDYLDAAFQSAMVRHHGKFWNFEGVPVMPRMRPEPRRRKWMTVFSEPSAVAGARRGYKLCTGFQATEKVARVYRAHRNAARETGWSAGPDDYGLRRQVLLCETNAEAEALNRELLQAAARRMAALAAKLGVGGEAQQSGVMDAPEGGGFMPPGLLSPEDEYICGAPAAVAERIIDQCRRTGTGNFLAFHANGLEPHELDRHYKLWEKVVPVLNRADIPPRGAG